MFIQIIGEILRDDSYIFQDLSWKKLKQDLPRFPKIRSLRDHSKSFQEFLKVRQGMCTTCFKVVIKKRKTICKLHSFLLFYLILEFSFLVYKNNMKYILFIIYYKKTHINCEEEHEEEEE